MTEAQEIQKDLIAYDRETARRSLWDFARMIWPLVEGSREFMENWHHRVICETLEQITAGKLRRVVINVPPRTTKSTLVAVIWPLWWWIRDQSRQFLSGSHNDALAVRDALKTRRVIEHPWFRARWPEVEIEADQNQKTRYDLKGGGKRITFGMSSGVTGEGGDVLIIDDPHPAKEGMYSEANRLAVKRCFDGELFTRLNDPSNSAIVIIMQRLHDDDLTGYVLRGAGWHHVCIPMEHDGEQRPGDPRKEIGQLLHPDRFGPAWIAAAKERLGTWGYAGQMQQRPAPEGGAIIKDAWTRHRWAALPKPDAARWYQSWDLKAGSKDPSSSYVVGQVWCVPNDAPAQRWLVDQVRGQWDIIETMQALTELSTTYPQAKTKWIEDKADGKAVVKMLEGRVQGLILCRPEGGGKVARLRAVLPPWEAGNVLLPEAAEWLPEYLRELLLFPASEHDDQVDATSQALYQLEGDENFSLSTLDFSLDLGARRSPWRM